METLESSCVCRLCGQQSGIFINIFDKNENHVKKISAVLPILVHEMDLLPKQMCHRCSVKLEEFHKFYSDCLKTDMNLKSQLSWMRKREVKEHIRVPMVQIENVKIKTEPPDYDIYELDPIVENVNYISSMSSMRYSMDNVRNNNEVNSHRLNDNIDKRLTSNDKRFADCSHCKFNYDKNNLTNEAALSINCTNMRSKRDDSGTMNLGSSSRLNENSLFKNVHENDENHIKEKKRFSRELEGLNIDNILNTNQVKEIKIKTEKPDDIEIRSLRLRKKSVDYIGTKRKKSDVIINPANVSRIMNVKRKSGTKESENFLLNGIVIDKIKKEPMEEVQSRMLRPRKFLIDYLGPKRKSLSSAKIDVENRSKSEDIRVKRPKSSFGSGKRCTGLISVPNEFRVKQEIVSDEETVNIEENNETRVNEVSESLVPNLGNLFQLETAELAIKVEKNIENEMKSCNWEVNAAGSRENRISQSFTEIKTSKSKPRKIGGKRVLDTNGSPKYLRSQDLRLRNGKVKKSKSNEQLSLGSLKKRLFDELAARTTTTTTTSRKITDKRLPRKIKENLNLIKVPMPLKNSSNIKHFCEKCSVTFMNKELYMLHACYYG